MRVRDAQGNSFTVDVSIPVEPGGFALLVRNGDPALNDGITDFDYDYADDGLSLNNGSDETIYLEFGTAIIDQVSYDGAGIEFPFASGASMILAPGALDAASNDDGANWCVSTTVYGSDGNAGTPGAANDACSGSSFRR